MTKKKPAGKVRETVGPPKSAAEPDPDALRRAQEDAKNHATPAAPAEAEPPAEE